MKPGLLSAGTPSEGNWAANWSAHCLAAASNAFWPAACCAAALAPDAAACRTAASSAALAVVAQISSPRLVTSSASVLTTVPGP